MKILALKGKDNTGKSLTLETLLFNLLKTNSVKAKGFIYEDKDNIQEFEYSHFEKEINEENQDLISKGS